MRHIHVVLALASSLVALTCHAADRPNVILIYVSAGAIHPASNGRIRSVQNQPL
jgi:hypothetical protein